MKEHESARSARSYVQSREHRERVKTTAAYRIHFARAAAMSAQALLNMISRGELIGMAVLLVMPKGGKVIVGRQPVCGMNYFRESKCLPCARSKPDTRSRIPCHLYPPGPYLPEVSLLSERVQSEFINSSKLSGDKYVFLFRTTHSVLRTTANRVQYVDSTPANQTMGSCASFVITKKGSSTLAMGR